ncbi:MAG: hypothetical protein ACP5NC_01330 [Nitrososphaeria archaeon]
MIGEGGYRALERGDLISAFNEFSLAENSTDSPLERSRMMINQGALLLAMGKYSLAVEELLRAKALLKSAEPSGQLMAVTCLNIAKAMIAVGRVENAESELRCAEGIVGQDDPHAVYVKALIYFYRGNEEKLENIKESGMQEPYGRLIRLLKLRIKADRGEGIDIMSYKEALKDAVPQNSLRDALGLV